MANPFFPISCWTNCLIALFFGLAYFIFGEQCHFDFVDVQAEIDLSPAGQIVYSLCFLDSHTIFGEQCHFEFLDVQAEVFTLLRKVNLTMQSPLSAILVSQQGESS